MRDADLVSIDSAKRPATAGMVRFVAVRTTKLDAHVMRTSSGFHTDVRYFGVTPIS
jgi:hypothetical protein